MEREFIRVERTASWRQLGVIVTDGSGSMTWPVEGGGFKGTKGEAVCVAVQGLLSRMAVSDKAANFHFAGVTFDEVVRDVWGPSPVTDLDPLRNYDPTARAGGGTNISAGIQETERIVTDFLAESSDGLPSTAVVLLLTDGEDGDAAATEAAAARLQADPRVKLACAFLATKGESPQGLDLLQRICTPPATQWCTTVYDPESLRKFWTASLSVVAPAGAEGRAVESAGKR